MIGCSRRRRLILIAIKYCGFFAVPRRIGGTTRVIITQIGDALSIERV
jgi:hypothetical protein